MFPIRSLSWSHHAVAALLRVRLCFCCGQAVQFLMAYKVCYSKSLTSRHSRKLVTLSRVKRVVEVSGSTVVHRSGIERT